MRYSVMALAVLLSAAPAAAQQDSVTIHVSSADFSTDAGRAGFAHKVRGAIEQVCGSYAVIETAQVPGMDECWKAARASVDKQLSSLKQKTEIKVAAGR
jgi:UrcA family protein